MSRKVGLIILDGWGIGDKSKSDAVFNSSTPVMDNLMNNYPNATLTTFGEEVGLPAGQMGNSEVGHLNIGAGRIVYQELTRINKSIREKEFFKNKALVQAFETAQNGNGRIHFMGLVSKGGVHSSQEHLYALCEMAELYNVKDVFIHAFTDGRDCDPKSGKGFLNELQEFVSDKKAKIATVIGRYFAMDRDNRWERVKQAYDLMVNNTGAEFSQLNQVFTDSYAANVTDEFIAPTVITENGKPVAKIKEGDTVICFNFRTDRPREISTVLTQKDFPELDMKALDINYYTMTSYDASFKNVNVIFEKDNLKNTLGEVLERENKSQVRIAETEKYPHVTFFFSGGQEKEFEGESRILVNSPKVATYDLQPEMSAPEVASKLIAKIEDETPDFFCLNFANPDMVGHTGVYNAVVRAVETVDTCLGDILETAKSFDYEVLVIADHGNADFVINPDGSPNTAHSVNPVPFVLLTNDKTVKVKDGILADMATTILGRMNINQPEEMTGSDLSK